MEQKKLKDISIGIAGLGLIGGSLALDLKSLGYKVIGLTHKEKTANRAKERGLVNEVSTNPEIFSNCEIVILALPLAEILNPSSSLITAIPKSAVVTDVGSVKAPVLKVWGKIHPRFVGSHPMAGTAESGIEAGREKLFINRPWICTPESNTDKEALMKIKKLAVAIGSNWITARADNHDQAVALISHLPVLVSAALISTINNEHEQSIKNLAISLISSGFEDTSRVGGGNPDLGTAMAKNNTDAILQALTAYRWSLEQLEECLMSKHWPQLNKELEKTQILREAFLKDK